MVLSKDMKKAICFGLIVGCIISILQLVGFCAESEVVSPVLVSNLRIDADGTFKTSDGVSVGYIPIEPGFKYTFTCTSGSRRLSYSNSVPVVGGSSDVIGLYSNYSFNGGAFNYLYFDYQHNSNCVITREELVGMTDFVDNLAYDLSYGNLNDVVSFVVPIMAISILFALGFYLLKRLLNKIKRLKGGI